MFLTGVESASFRKKTVQVVVKPSPFIHQTERVDLPFSKFFHDLNVRTTMVPPTRQEKFMSHYFFNSAIFTKKPVEFRIGNLFDAHMHPTAGLIYICQQ